MLEINRTYYWCSHCTDIINYCNNKSLCPSKRIINNNHQLIYTYSCYIYRMEMRSRLSNMNTSDTTNSTLS